VQVDPITPSLKAPGTKRLKLQFDGPRSNFAFKFNSRRYSQAAVGDAARRRGVPPRHAERQSRAGLYRRAEQSVWVNLIEIIRTTQGEVPGRRPAHDPPSNNL